MVLLWTQHENGGDPKDHLSGRLPPQSSNFFIPHKSLPTSPGSIIGISHHPRVSSRPPKPPLPSTHCGRSSMSPSVLSSSAESSGTSILSSSKFVVAVRDVSTPRKVNLSRSFSTYDPRTSTLKNGRNGNLLELQQISFRNSSLDNQSGISISGENINGMSNPIVATELDVTRSPVIRPKHAQYFKSVDKCENSKTKPETVDGLDEREDINGSSDSKSTKKDRKRYYSLPRNWRGKATDFIWSRGKTLCEHCGKKCSGEVLRVQEKYFHVSCFSCKGCSKSLAQGGFFTRGPDHFCTACYQSQFGQRCATCGQYVEGEVVSALGNTYHQKCFTCARCRQPFPSGERVTYTGKECLCQRCFQIPVMDSQSPVPSPSQPGPKCAGCHEELLEGQALIALDRQWHIWCFKCASCGTLLHGEYMGKDGLPYCEKDYQTQFGVRCAYCDRFISGKVLQAGDNHHFHPTCARCTKCGDPFGDGEEMYLQGTAIWHPRCGPGPTESGTVLNGHSPATEQQQQTNGHVNGHVEGHQKSPQEKDLDGMSSTASETQFWSTSRTPSLNGSLNGSAPPGASYSNSYTRKCSGPYRTCSPGLILREYKSNRHSPVDVSRIYTYSYLAAEPSQGYLKKPIDPYDRPPKSPHFHRPPGGEKTSRPPLGKIPSRTGMRVLVNQIQSETPRPKSPHMNNEEPISLAHYPGGRKPKQNQPSRIEREDFPAPPYPYTDPERRRRWSGSSKGVSVDESADEHADEVDADDSVPEDPKLKREEAELAKISSGIGKVFLQQVREREKIRAWRATHLDPRNASRTPSATREPVNKMRFDSSYNASPSRVVDTSRWTDDEYDGHPSARSSGRSSATLPSYSVVSSLRQPPKPGYGFSPRTNFYRPGLGSYSALHGDTNSLTGMGDKTHSTDFSSARSDVSAGSLTDADRSALTGGADICPSATYSSGLRGYSSHRYSPHLRRSLPNMLHPNHPHHPHHIHNQDQPPKIYPAHLLFTTNYRLPNDVDRCHLERHLSDHDFELVFRMSRMDFYRMPEWQRNDIKRRCHMF